MAWKHDRAVRRNRRWIRAVSVVVLMVAMGAGWFVLRHMDSRTSSPSFSASESPDIEQSRTIQGRYLFNGTVTWSRGVEQYAGTDAAQPFSQLDTFNRAQYDAWTASLECPITGNAVPFRTQVDNLLFNCPPRFLPEAMKFFTIYNLANNHTYDQNGETGLEETQTHLRDAGAQYFGSYDSSDGSNVCEVVALPVRINDNERGSLPVAFCGWQYFSGAPSETELSVMDRYQKIMPVIAFVEAGVEYRAAADDKQVSVGRALVDRGADFVIINSPHWVQNTEAYHGRLIMYSLGNFIFDQLETETNRSVSLDVVMNLEDSENTQRWLDMGEACAKHQDDCLVKAEAQRLQKLSPAYTFGVAAGVNGYRVIAHKADAATQRAVEERTNWAQTCQQLGYNMCQ